MTTPQRRIAAIAERQYGVFSRAQALRVGFTSDAIDGNVARGTWVVVFRGAYRMAGSVVVAETLPMAATLAVPVSYASHTTAARLWGIEGLGVGTIHVAVRRPHGARASGIVVHRLRTLTAKDTTHRGAIPLTTAARTLIDLAAILDERALEIALDSALRQHLVDPPTLERRLSAECRPGRRGIRRLHALVRDRTKGRASESKWETQLYRLLADFGLPRPTRQYEIRRPDGSFVGRVDLAYPEAKLFLEFDGYTDHSSRIAFDEDRRRQNEIVALGWIPLRFTKTDLWTRSARVGSLVESTLRQRLVVVDSGHVGQGRPNGARTRTDRRSPSSRR